MAVYRFHATGSLTWKCPPGVTSVFVQCWAGGGGSGGVSSTSANSGSGGGGGGAYAHGTVAVTPGTVYNVFVGLGGTAGANTGTAGGNGKETWFKDTGTVYAFPGAGSAGVTTSSTGGAAGAGGASGSCIGDVVYSGGNGAAGTTSKGAGGGSGAGGYLDSSIVSGGNGNAGSGTTPGAVKAQYGGVGGAGRGTPGAGTIVVTTTTNGNNYGGGAGGALNLGTPAARAGAAGRRGECIIHYRSGEPFLSF